METLLIFIGRPLENNTNIRKRDDKLLFDVWSLTAVGNVRCGSLCRCVSPDTHLELKFIALSLLFTRLLTQIQQRKLLITFFFLCREGLQKTLS